jgi:hypothetical protein
MACGLVPGPNTACRLVSGAGLSRTTRACHAKEGLLANPGAGIGCMHANKPAGGRGVRKKPGGARVRLGENDLPGKRAAGWLRKGVAQKE